MYGQTVELTADLTSYHPGLVVGVRGVTTAPVGMWARTYDRFVSVQFGPGIGNWDILWSSLRHVPAVPAAVLTADAKGATRP